MAVEIERRFLLTGDGWRSLAGAPQPLRQGYLAASAEVEGFLHVGQAKGLLQAGHAQLVRTHE